MSTRVPQHLLPWPAINVTLQAMKNVRMRVGRHLSFARAAVFVVAGLLTTTASPASAQADASWQQAYAAGDYADAARGASAAATSHGDALAARAYLAQARQSARSERAELVALARDAAKSSVARNPGHIEGHLQLAVALGYQGRAMGNILAHQRGLGADARRAIDAALALAPDDPWARALSGTWHLEIVKGAGPLLAAALYEASLDTGLADIRAAATTPGVSVIVLYQCALQLLAVDADAFGDEAERLLAAASKNRGEDAFERYTSRQAGRLLRAYRSGNEALLAREIERGQMSY